MKKRIYYSLLLLHMVRPLIAQLPPNVELQQVASGFTNITNIVNAGDHRLFVTEQAGRIRVIDLNTGMVSLFMDISNRINSGTSERGLLGLAFHPQYEQNGWFFVHYSNLSGNTVIARYSVSAGNPNQGDPNSELIILTATQPFINHNGGDIQFGPNDGFLYISLGDGGSANDPGNRSQNPQTLLGKILRIDVNQSSQTQPYQIPPSNPFVGNTSTLDEIWALGLRNAWRMTFDRLTGDLWIADVGQNAFEEINLQPANSPGGENYGWRCYEANNPFNTAGCQPASAYTFPVFAYPHSGNGCSVTGGYRYRGSLYNDMYGRYFYADYCSGRMWSLAQDAYGNFSTFQHLQITGADFSAFGEDAYGELYIARRGNGTVQKLVSNNCTPKAILNYAGPTTICEGNTALLQANEHPAFAYTWYKNGEALPNANGPSFIATESGLYHVEIQAAPGCVAQSDSLLLDFIPGDLASIINLDTLICLSDFNLDVQLQGLPAGGQFSGAGVFDALFVPTVAGIGLHTIQYSYVSQEGCTSTAQKIFSVQANPSITFGNCVDTIIMDMPVGAPYLLEAMPIGGTFSGMFINEQGAIDLIQLNNYGQAVPFYYQVTQNGCSATDSCLMAALITVSLPNKKPLQSIIRLFPNPGSDELRMVFKENIPPNTLLSCTDLSGKRLFSRQVNNEELLISEVMHLAPGIYLFQWQAANGEWLSHPMLWVKQ